MWALGKTWEILGHVPRPVSEVGAGPNRNLERPSTDHLGMSLGTGA
jgi:hypothetical protein